MEDCGGSVLTGLQTPACWRAGPKAKRVLSCRLALGTPLPTPCRDVNRLGRGQRDTEAPSNRLTVTLANPGHTLFGNPQPQRVHRTPQAGALFSLMPRNCHNTSRVLETCGPPISAVHASSLWRFCARRASDGPLQGPNWF